MGNQVDIHPADPALRRIAVWLPATVAIAGGLAVWALHRWLQSLSGTDATEPLLLTFFGLAVVLATASMTLAFVLWNVSSNVLREDRYPPANMRTTRDVAVRHGPAARRAADWLRIGALLAATLGAGVIAWALLAVGQLG